jgi:hypothetical protein
MKENNIIMKSAHVAAKWHGSVKANEMMASAIISKMKILINRNEIIMAKIMKMASA